MELQTGAVVDRYAVEGLLGQGGMAVVYRVRHERLGSLHALKVLLLPAKSIRARLLQEGRVQAQLRHPNVVSVTDVIEVDGSPGLVMEYVAGPCLDDLLRQVHLSVDQADLLGRGVLEGVAAAHEAGLIHRDLKPGNILLEIGKAGLTPKITDFGLAKLVDVDGGGSSMTRSGLAMGTPCYMAPEQIRNAKGVDERADVFSLGCVLYELITGQRAFDGADTFEIFSAVTSGQYTPVKALRADAPERMIHAIARALDTDRDNRVGTVSELLDLWVDGVPAPLVGTTYQAAFIARAVELGSAGDLPSSLGSGADGTVSETMDWSLGSAAKAGLAADHAPQPVDSDPIPVPAKPMTESPASMAPSTASVGMAMFGGMSLLIGVLLVGVVVAGGGYLYWAGTQEVERVPVETPVAAVPKPRPIAEPTQVQKSETPHEDTHEVPKPSPKVVSRPTKARPAPVDAAATPDIEAGEDEALPEQDLLADEPFDELLDADLPEAGDDTPEVGADELITEPPIEEPVAMGTFAVSVRYHPMTPGAETHAPVFLVDGNARYTPGPVPVGDYFIEAKFARKGSPIRAGKLTITEDNTSRITCFTATRECRPD